MDTITAISQRRSIRKFLPKEIDNKTIEKILEAGILAPSAKNTQPWKFVVITNKNKEGMLNALKSGIEIEKSGNGLYKGEIAKSFINGAEYTLKIMEEAPITIFVINTGNKILFNRSYGEVFTEMANVQSIGASIQNILLASGEYGIGSLWICDIFIAYKELCKWLNTDQQLVAAISLGYPDENPPPRPRKGMGELVEWR
ncbi:MAG: nitroreductase [Clostridiales bacterium]|jgi:nitroreductase|nr:nitroreductase [Clostridiales bacterium]